MDIGLALTYVTKDQDWIKKVLIGGLLILIPIVGAMIFYGYAVRIVRNVISGSPNPLPDWDDIGGDLSRGFFVFVGSLIWALPVYALYFCSLIVGSVSDEAGILSGLIIICLVFPLGLVFGVFVGPTIVGRFAATNQFSSMLQFNEVIATIRRVGIGPHLLFLVLGIVAGIISSVGLIACFIGILFTTAYAYMAQAHGVGQLTRLGTDTGGFHQPVDHPAF